MWFYLSRFVSKTVKRPWFAFLAGSVAGALVGCLVTMEVMLPFYLRGVSLASLFTAEEFAKRGEDANALLYFERAIGVDPQSTAAHVGLAEFFEKKGYPVLALWKYQHALMAMEADKETVSLESDVIMERIEHLQAEKTEAN